MDTHCQYEMEHFICIETAILETEKVGTSLSTICWYVVHLLKNPTNGTFSHHEHTQGKLPALKIGCYRSYWHTVYRLEWVLLKYLHFLCDWHLKCDVQ